nr:hypothetical protein [Tanacetum cinerariifolium]
ILGLPPPKMHTRQKLAQDLQCNIECHGDHYKFRMKKRFCWIGRDELPSYVGLIFELDETTVGCTQDIMSLLVNGSPCDRIDMIIKDLDLEPKIDAMMRDFLDKETSSKILLSGDGSRGETFKPIVSLVSKGKLKSLVSTLRHCELHNGLILLRHCELHNGLTSFSEIEEEDPQEEEDDLEVDIKEDENDPKLTYAYEEMDPLNPPPPTFESEPKDAIEVENPIEHEDETIPASVHEVGESSTAPFLREDSDGLLHGLIRRDINSLELEKARFSNTFLRMQNERVKRDLYWTRVRAHEFYQEMICKGFMFEERSNEAINVLTEDEKSPSSEPRGSPYNA